jgi:hypothetical protein
VPVSFLQVLLPKFRIEIQLFYNAVVFIPMMIGMYYHMFPPKEEEAPLVPARGSSFAQKLFWIQRSGFAARCEARLCLAVESRHSIWATPSVRALP